MSEPYIRPRWHPVNVMEFFDDNSGRIFLAFIPVFIIAGVFRSYEFVLTATVISMTSIAILLIVYVLSAILRIRYVMGKY